MKNILITGGSGFIGRNLTEHFKDSDYLLLKPSHAKLPLEDEEKVDEYFNNHKVDIIIHAAVKPYHRAATDTNHVALINIKMYFNLIKQVQRHDIEKMLVTGTGSEYSIDCYTPDMNEAYFGENIPKDDGTFSRYVIAKHIEDSTLPVFNLRIFGVFGKYEDYRIRFISNAICKLLYDIPISLRQDRLFSYIFIDDLIKIIKLFLCCTPKNKTYNIVPDYKSSLLNLAQKVVALSGKSNHKINVLSDGLGSEYTGTNNRLLDEFPGITFTDIDDCILSLIKYYKENLTIINKNELFTDDKANVK